MGDLPPPLDLLDSGERAVLEQFLEPVSFPAGSTIFEEGDDGDACYLIDEGVVRVEVPDTEIDTDAVLGFVEPPDLLGEVAVLDDQPRSASARAHTDVRARRFASEALESLLAEHPHIGARVLAAFGRDAARKLRGITDRLAEHLFVGGRDPAVDAVVDQAVDAQRTFAAWDEERVDRLLSAIAEAVAAESEALAKATVEETQIGNVADKARKNYFASMGVYMGMAADVGAGQLGAEQDGVTEIGDPAGVVFAIIPMTNPVATAIFKVLNALKARNALVLSFHRACLGVGSQTGEIIRAVLHEHGAPENLVQWITKRGSRATTYRFMSHPQVALILATGGPGLVQAAYSSGTPAIGVGAGNGPAYVAADADIAQAADLITLSKSFDNGLICGAENHVVAPDSVYDQLVTEFEDQGAAVLTPDERARFEAAVLDEAGVLRSITVGQSAELIADVAGIARDRPIRLIVVPLENDLEHPLAGEKMAPIVSLYRVEGEDEGFALCRALLEGHGTGHTAMVHTTDDALVDRFAHEVPVARILVNGPGSQAVCGLTTGLVPSLTLGCGTYGGNSTTDNVGYRNLRNVKRIARPVPERVAVFNELFSRS